MEFYFNAWYHVQVPAQHKEVMRKIKLVVTRVCDFLPDECILILPPRRGDQAFRDWYVQLETHARTAEKNMLKYIALTKPNACVPVLWPIP
jgi:hypothetical protein